MSLGRLVLGAVLHNLSKDSILPFSCLGIKVTIELSHEDRFGVQNVVVDLFEVGKVSDGSHSVSESLVVRGLSSTSGSNDHESVTNLNCIVKLDGLVQEGLNRLLVEIFAAINKLGLKLSVVNDWALNTWEQIVDNVFEERYIILEELGHIDISQRSQQELVFCHIGISSLEETSGVNDRFDSSHSVIVMILRRELL